MEFLIHPLIAPVLAILTFLVDTLQLKNNPKSFNTCYHCYNDSLLVQVLIYYLGGSSKRGCSILSNNLLGQVSSIFVSEVTVVLAWHLCFSYCLRFKKNFQL